ncbi:MAG: glycosyltransferase family 2 protein [Planctomycetia bacterium]|nr:glycosyltransferase family 2 protein [Planctomycetia bacterium]
MNDLKLTVVIPAHNEEQNLPAVLTDLASELRQSGIPCEIVVVNDNSRDGTAAVVQGLMAAEDCIRLVNRTAPNGFGRAVRTGIENATGDVIVIYMADASDHPIDVVRYYRKIEEGYDCVFGSRFVPGSQVVEYPPLKLVANRIVNKLMQWFFFVPFNDLTNAFKAYRMSVVRDCGPYRACHFNITIEMSLNAIIRKYNIAQIPIAWTGRTWGSSNLRLREMGRRYLATLLKVIAERLLIADDLLAERLAASARRESELIEQRNRLRTLEQRVSEIEERLPAVEPLRVAPGREAA